MKKQFISLALAVMMLLGVTGCAMSTPSSVGTIGGVDIPAGVYLLAQYNAYNTASSAAELATGETASDVKAVLKAQCTGTIGDEEVTTDGADYVSRLTLRSLQYYAAVEKKFQELGGVLDDAATAEAAQRADSLWESNGDLYTANGIGKASLETYLLNAQKAQACLELIYGENGSNPVTEQEYLDYITNDCAYLESVQLPLFDQSTYAFATEDQKNEITALAEQCRDELNAATSESAAYLAQAPNRDNWQEILRGLCRYFRENRAFYCNAMSYNGQNSLREYLFDTFSGVVQQHLLDGNPCALEPQDAAFAGEFFAATIVGLLERWCARGMREDAARYEDCLTRILSGEMLNTYLRSVSPESDQ